MTVRVAEICFKSYFAYVENRFILFEMKEFCIATLFVMQVLFYGAFWVVFLKGSI